MVIKQFIVSLMAATTTTLAYTDQDVVAATLVHEAGGEYYVGALEAVHEVIHNRSKNRGLSRFEVCLQRFQFSCWNGASIVSKVEAAKNHPRWSEAMRIVRSIHVTNYTNGANHYHADYISEPSWADRLEETVQIGRHIFYK
jgi:spore germination cell wall hydrolase CwlJ-like protein